MPFVGPPPSAATYFPGTKPVNGNDAEMDRIEVLHSITQVSRFNTFAAMQPERCCRLSRAHPCFEQVRFAFSKPGRATCCVSNIA